MLQAEIALANEGSSELDDLLLQKADAILERGQRSTQVSLKGWHGRRGSGSKRGSLRKRTAMQPSELLKLLKGETAPTSIQRIQTRRTLSQAQPTTQGLGIDLE